MTTAAQSEASGPSDDPVIGTMLGAHLRIVRRIARGGTGTVYMAVDPSADRKVAVKMLNASSSADDESYRCFRNEVLSLARVSHPHAVRLYDWGRAPDGQWYIVMEYLTGQSLDDLLKEGPISPERTLQVLDDVAAVLEESHELGIVHRDIKPQNIFLQRVGDEDYVRLLDFGIARLLHQPATTDRPSGTPAYMSPEQIQGVEIDGRADIYSLGIVAYECLGGRPPFDVGTPITVMARQVSEIPRPLRLAVASDAAPPGLIEFVAALMEKDPDERPSSIRDVRQRIKAFRSRLEGTGALVAAGASVPAAARADSAPSRAASASALASADDGPSSVDSEASTLGDLTASAISRVPDGLSLVMVGLIAVLLAIAMALYGSQRNRTAAGRAGDGPAGVLSDDVDDAPPLPREGASTLAQRVEDNDARTSAEDPVAGRLPSAARSTNQSGLTASSSSASSVVRGAARPNIEPSAEGASRRQAMAGHSQTRSKIRRASLHVVEVCYELMAGATLRTPQLSVDGRVLGVAAKNGCFRVRLYEGRHRFVLLGQGVQLQRQQVISASQRRVFFLVE